MFSVQFVLGTPSFKLDRTAYLLIQQLLVILAKDGRLGGRDPGRGLESSLSQGRPLLGVHHKGVAGLVYDCAACGKQEP